VTLGDVKDVAHLITESAPSLRGEFVRREKNRRAFSAELAAVTLKDRLASQLVSRKSPDSPTYIRQTGSTREKPNELTLTVRTNSRRPFGGTDADRSGHWR
jgi:hypothetical protein